MIRLIGKYPRMGSSGMASCPGIARGIPSAMFTKATGGYIHIPEAWNWHTAF